MPTSHAAKLNIKRGMTRAWALFTLIWLVTIGGMWLSIFWNDLTQIQRELVQWAVPVDYDALCAKLRGQRAAGRQVDAIPAIPALLLVVNDGIGKIVGAPGRCLVVFAQEEGVELEPVAFRIVDGDGSALREIESASGKRRPIGDFMPVPPAQRQTDYGPLLGGLAFVLGIPIGLFSIGAGLWWVAMGFKPHDSSGLPRQEPAGRAIPRE